MKSSVKPKTILNVSDNEDEKAIHETRSKFSLIKQINHLSPKPKYSKLQLSYSLSQFRPYQSPIRVSRCRNKYVS